MKNKLKTTWRKVRLGKVSTLITKGTTPTTIGGDFVSKGINFIKAESITDDGCFIKEKFGHIDEKTNQLLKRSVILESDILYSIAGVIGRSALATKEVIPANTNQALAIIRLDKNQVDPKYIFYVLSTKKQRNLANSFVAQSVQANINLKQVGDFEIYLPEITEQKRIASILSAFDDKIELNNKISKNLEQTAQAIFKEWFVSFKFPGYEKVKMVNSELGKIPEGWKIGSFKDLLKVKHGFAFPSDKFKTNGIPVIKIKNILENNRINLKEVDFIELNDFKNLENFELKNGDILIAMTGATSGKIGVLIGDYLDYFLNQRVGKFEFFKPENKWFSFIYLTQSNIRSMLLGLSDGSAQGNLSPSQLENLEIVIPESKILQKFDSIINNWFLNIQKNEIENQKLVALRDLLLPRLMSGEIRIAT